MSILREALEELSNIVGGGVIFTDDENLNRVSIDNSRYFFKADALVKARGNSDVEAALKVANKYKIPLAVRGAGSGCSGAALPYYGGIVLDLSAINFIKVDPSTWIAHVGAGAINSRIDQEAKKFSLMYPPDPSSKDYSTIGGNIACNAGGLRAAKYGTTRDYVMALSGFLPTGEFVNLSRPLRKFSTAMNLRDLMIGSEGTLGVITEAWLKLVKRPEAKVAARAFFNSYEEAFNCVAKVFESGLMPSVLEFMDAESVWCAAKFCDTSMKESVMLLFELDGTLAELKDSEKKLGELLKELSRESDFADSAEEAENLWRMRRVCSPAMFLLNNSKINQDIVLPLASTVEFFKFFKQLSKSANLQSPTFGHAADGNYHIHLMYDKNDAAQKKLAYSVMEKTIIKAIELGGAISGEHAIGITKSKYLHYQLSSAELNAMLAVKRALDPNNILNPQAVYANIDISKYSQRLDIKLPWDKH